jgi:hypothetical protein
VSVLVVVILFVPLVLKIPVIDLVGFCSGDTDTDLIPSAVIPMGTA